MFISGRYAAPLEAARQRDEAELEVDPGEPVAVEVDGGRGVCGGRRGRAQVHLHDLGAVREAEGAGGGRAAAQR